jgi:hypothetical protein
VYRGKTDLFHLETRVDESLDQRVLGCRLIHDDKVTQLLEKDGTTLVIQNLRQIERP